MHHFPSFFITSLPADQVQGSHHLGLVVLSILVSVFSAFMALQTAHIAQRAEKRWHHHVALVTGALALGGGIWTMHFIGMLAYHLPTYISYDTSLTLLSLVPACLTSWIALWILAKQRVRAWQRTLSGILVGSGIGLMHYIGMAAMQTDLVMQYEPVTFGLSIVVAVVLSIFALWIRDGLRNTSLSRMQAFAASGIMTGLAIAATHYTGMHAVVFTGTPSEVREGWIISSTYASIALSFFTVTVTVMVAALNGLIHSRELNRKIDASQSRLQATLDTAVDGIITIDSRGLIQSFNRSAERLFGWQAHEVLGKNIKILMPEPDQSRHDGYLENYHNSGEPKIIGIGREVMGLRKDGSLMPMRLAVGRMDIPGELLFVGFVTDISERHALEASLRETAERAEQAAAAKSTFLANMSHEIRTPMNSIIGFTELLLQQDLTDTQRSHLNNIRQSSRTLLGLINDILDTTKLEKGQFEIESNDFSLKALALQIESTLWPSAQQKGLKLTTLYPASMPEYFKGDALRILQILTNLVGNAIKFTEVGGVEVVFSYKEGIVTIAVHDSGIGMSESQLEAIFAPFTQADASISRRFGGTGLGTTIARQLAERMQGRISVTSQLGSGSTFEVTLPLPIGAAPEQTLETTEVAHLPPLEVLIADDVPQNLELLALTLTSRGHRVREASNGADAFTLFKQHHFDVVLMDVHMPGTDGLQATRLIRQYERTHNRTRTPIIALTASVMNEDRVAAEHAGMDGFAVKPLDVPRLMDTIARVMGISPKPTIQSVLTRDDDALIDWTQGITLWGSRERLLEAIAAFVENALEKYPLAFDPNTPDTLLFSLHSLRGATGNLALKRLLNLVKNLETEIKNGQFENIPTALEAIKTAIAQIKEQCQRRILTPAPSSQGTFSMQTLTRLQEVLARNELDDDALKNALESLAALGHSTEAQALKHAIDNFDFEHAKTQLSALTERLS